jgi:hypothetical protein
MWNQHLIIHLKVEKKNLNGKVSMRKCEGFQKRLPKNGKCAKIEKVCQTKKLIKCEKSGKKH